MELYHPYRVMMEGIIDDRVAPYPKLCHPYRVFFEFTLIIMRNLYILIFKG
jgi:hypothetical protein